MTLSGTDVFGNPVTKTTTSADGSDPVAPTGTYAFVVAPGTYQITFTVPDGWTPSPVGAGDDPATASVGAGPAAVTVTGGARLDLDLGLHRPATPPIPTTSPTPTASGTPSASPSASPSSTPTAPAGGVLSLTKTNRQDSLAPGAQVTYDLTVTNHQDTTVTGVSVIDTLPAGMAFVSASDGGTHQGGKVTWQVGDIPAGASRTVQLAVKITATAGQSLTNTAHAVAAGGQASGATVTASDTDPVLTPGNPPSSASPSPTATPPGGMLATTGAAFGGAVLLALLLAGLGTVLLIRRRSTAR